MADPVVLVLGCGIAGVAAARELRSLLPSSHRVIAIDKEAVASYPPSYLWVMTGDRRPDAIKRRRAQLAGKGIEFVHATVHQIDLDARYVRAEGREFHYDYLILALGAEPALETVPGLAEAAYHFQSLEGAERLAASLRYFAGGKVVIAVAAAPSRWPTAPYEAAMLLEHYFHQCRIRQKVEIDLFSPEESPFQVAGSVVGEEIRGLLAHKGITFHRAVHPASVDAFRRELVLADGNVAPFQLLISVPDLHVPGIVRESGLVDQSGWIAVDPLTLETRRRGVFAAGDATDYPLPDGIRLPKTGLFAEKQARIAARNIAHRLIGGPAPDPLDGNARLFLDVGAGAAALIEGAFVQPQRQIEFRQPSLIWHWAKLAQERYWLLRTY